MNKTELQAKADGLVDEINFLRALYEAVSFLPHLLFTLMQMYEVLNVGKCYAQRWP